MQSSFSSHFALVLPGAVARGAYEAGVIEVLANNDLRIDRIVATSSGALNGLAYAFGIRNGIEKEMATKLAAYWIENGGWETSLGLSPINLFTGRGLSNSSGLLKLMREMIQPMTGIKNKREVELRIIITPLNGVRGSIGAKAATTFEKLIRFSGEDLDTEEGLERVFNVVAAACAFPGLFQPVYVEGLGACVDGGAVNNAPIKYALEESGVNRVIMPVPYALVMEPGDWKRGFSLLNHMATILINERLYRDLRNAQITNQEMDQLKNLVSEKVINQEQLERIKSLLGIRNVEITEIRPIQQFKSSPFSGLFYKKDRRRLIEMGREAALDAITRIPPQNVEGVQTT